MKLTENVFPVYGVTNNNPTPESIESAIKGGVKIIQLRMKNKAEEDFMSMATKVKEICKDKAMFIINDNVEIALKADADGVHLGQGDMEIAKARKLIGNKIIGASAHNREEAIKAEKDGADYIGCGAVFYTDTKNDVTSLSIEELNKICEAVKIPVFAIGGITVDNMKCLKGSGINGVAVSSGIFNGDAEKNAKEFIERWKSI